MAPLKPSSSSPWYCTETYLTDAQVDAGSKWARPSQDGGVHANFHPVVARAGTDDELSIGPSLAQTTVAGITSGRGATRSSTGPTSAVNNLGGAETSPDEPVGEAGATAAVDADPSPTYTSTITVQPSPATTRATHPSRTADPVAGGGSDSTSIIANAAATTDLSWWQLLAIVGGCLLALSVGGWAWFRHRRKKQTEAIRLRKEMMEDEERRAQHRKDRELKEMIGVTAMAAGLGRGRGRSRSDSEREDSDEGSEGYDSVSDGGTIRPSRRRRRRRRRRRHNKRRGDYRREEKDWDQGRDFGHRSRRRGDDYDSDRDRNKDSLYSVDSYDARSWRERSHVRQHDRSHHRHLSSPPLSPRSPALTPGTGRTGTLGAKRRIRDTFRDSVFSSYTSMKKAAVRLKYVEAKVKLKRQLDEEERVEQERRAKVAQANREIEEYNQYESDLRHHRRDTTLLIPPVPRPPARARSPTPTVNTVDLPYDKPTAELIIPGGKPRGQDNHRLLYPPKSAIKQPRRPTMDRRGTSESLDGQIDQLLGGPTRGVTVQTHHIDPVSVGIDPFRARASEGEAARVVDQRALPARAPTAQATVSEPKDPQGAPSNSFQATWLTQPESVPTWDSPGVLTESPRSSVYIPVTRPQERPIPSEGSAPGLPPNAKLSSGRAAMPIMSHVKMRRAATAAQWDGPVAPINPRANAVVRGATMAGVGAGGGSNKWANRLRERR
ncbi:hypothetical protein IAU60_004874 [Kwoniella sp. DSM 27419]